MLPNEFKMSFQKFIDFVDKTDDRYEYMYGNVYTLHPPTVEHQVISSNLFLALNRCFKSKGCKVLHSPLDVIIGSNLVQPDLFVVSDKIESKNDKYIGTPSLIVEIATFTTSYIDSVKNTDCTCNLKQKNTGLYT